MTTDDIQLLYRDDRWANNRVVQSVSVLSAEQFTRNLGGAFKSVRDTLVHLMSGEWIWLQYWKAKSHDDQSIGDLQQRRKRLFDPQLFPHLKAVQHKWKEVEQDQIAFLNTITDESLNRMLPFRGTQVKLVHLMQHVTNHSTYHRGQIALMIMMRQLKAEPTATDFHVFLAEG